MSGLYFWLWGASFWALSGADLVYRKSGNVSVLGILNDRFGSDCSLDAAKGFEEIAAAIWTVEALNNDDYLPGITIGLSVFGTCEDFQNQNDLLRIEEDSNGVGILTTAAVSRRLKSVERFSSENILAIEHAVDADTLTDLVVQLLTNLQWRRVDAVVSDSPRVLRSFQERASGERILVEDEVLIGRSHSGRSRPLGGGTPSPVVVVLAAFANFSAVAGNLVTETSKLILAPTDFVFGRISDLPKNTIVLLPSVEEKEILSRFINNSERHRDFFGHRGPTKSPLFVGTAAALLKMLRPLKRFLEELPSRNDSLSALLDFVEDAKRNKTTFSPPEPPDEVEVVLNELKIERSPTDEMFLYITSLVDANASEDLAIFQVFSPKTENFDPILLMINADVVNGRWPTDAAADSRSLPTESLGNLKRSEESPEVTASTEKVPERPCDSSVEGRRGCQNSDENQTAGTEINDSMEIKPAAGWRVFTWVSINTALGVVGVACTLSVMLFVAVRTRRGYVPEGSPRFTLLLAVAVVLVYAASVPFHLELPREAPACGLRGEGPPAAFSLLFSLLLSRSVMSAIGQAEGGFAAHIDGHLQSVLCFFMLAVQVSITSQGWMRRRPGLEFDCSEIHDDLHMLVALGYDFLLLALLVCASPFIVRSKRNFREGLLFSVSVLLIVIVWSVWVGLYVSLPREHKDAAVAIGLNATASVVLTCILLPRAYSLAISSAPLPYLPRTILGDVLDRNYKSDQGLNDSVFGSITYKTSETGLSNPNFDSEGATGSKRADAESATPIESVLRRSLGPTFSTSCN